MEDLNLTLDEGSVTVLTSSNSGTVQLGNDDFTVEASTNTDLKVSVTHDSMELLEGGYIAYSVAKLGDLKTELNALIATANTSIVTLDAKVDANLATYDSYVIVQNDTNATTIAKVDELTAENDGYNVRIDGVEAVTAGTFVLWNPVNTPKIGNIKFVGDIQYQYLGGILGVNSDGWVRTDQQAKYDIDGVSATVTANKAAQLIIDAAVDGRVDTEEAARIADVLARKQEVIDNTASNYYNSAAVDGLITTEETARIGAFDDVSAAYKEYSRIVAKAMADGVLTTAELATITVAGIEVSNAQERLNVMTQNTANVSASLSSYQAVIDVSLADLQSQVDGTIATWFYDVEPTLLVVPASDWVTTDTTNGNDDEKIRHIGDLYYDRTTGYGYRFAWEDIVDVPDEGIIYSWIRIVDTDVVSALANAASAQDTADGKKAIYYDDVVPTGTIAAPLGTGDMWIPSINVLTYTQGVIYIYNAIGGTWNDATRYTDDTAANTPVTATSGAGVPVSAANPKDIYVRSDAWYTAASGLTITTSTLVSKEYGLAVYQYDGTSWDLLANGLALTTQWAGSASKLLHSPDGAITGWSFGDGSNLQSQFKVNADVFQVQTSTGGKAPLRVTADRILVDADIESTNYTWGSGTPEGFLLAKDGDTSSGNSYNIVGGKIYGGTIVNGNSTSIDANGVPTPTRSADNWVIGYSYPTGIGFPGNSYRMLCLFTGLYGSSHLDAEVYRLSQSPTMESSAHFRGGKALDGSSIPFVLIGYYDTAICTELTFTICTTDLATYEDDEGSPADLPSSDALLGAGPALVPAEVIDLTAIPSVHTQILGDPSGVRITLHMPYSDYTTGFRAIYVSKIRGLDTIPSSTVNQIAVHMEVSGSSTHGTHILHSEITSGHLEHYNT